MDLAGHSLQLVLSNHIGLCTLEMLHLYSPNNNSLIVLEISTTLAAMVAYPVKPLSTLPVSVVSKVNKLRFRTIFLLVEHKYSFIKLLFFD